VSEEDQMSGGFVVDPAGSKPDDRILIVNLWGKRLESHKYRNALAINGKSWPYTERFHFAVGDSVRWRLINGTTRAHPLHLHGFYFRVDSRGGLTTDTTYPPQSRLLAVTEHMPAATTISIVFSPNRPGNWLLHCHLAFHTTQNARLDGTEDEHTMHDADPEKHMAGLVVGITVKRRAGMQEAEVDWNGPSVRRLRLVATERPRAGGPTPLFMSYVLQRDTREPAADSVEKPGQPIVLTRDEPTEVTIVNRVHDGTSVHWHGIELESYSDGVPGWSGIDQLAPLVAPQDSFKARLTLPRAGTFIYHTHLNDIEQLTSGMYGPIIVLEPGESFDPSRDHVFTLGWDGELAPPHLLLNGEVEAPPLIIDSAKTHRFRFVNIGPALRFPVSIKRDTVLVSWTPLAKDGADLPVVGRKRIPATTALNVGETFDARIDGLEKGEYVLSFGPRTRRIIVQ
jgi:FtsP/CotA-like multicopper oxidase with cupredoxin domain